MGIKASGMAKTLMVHLYASVLQVISVQHDLSNAAAVIQEQEASFQSELRKLTQQHEMELREVSQRGKRDGSRRAIPQFEFAAWLILLYCR